ncbi:MAG: hypothetical protein SCARUB_01352 [Candidatus Scalindua rubra]|uniref:Uncharacterized protein n=1 Tax=Candidatus Scalindua rubra TaxID=1872076 RepID=A0A1E3XD56_9BACT|nr:MAG: hypothetical protein SCARUB_01352 [Candidatus Scalindua rubra]
MQGNTIEKNMPTPYQRQILKIIDEEGKDGKCRISLVNKQMLLGTDYVRGLLDSMTRFGLIDFIGSRHVRLTPKALRILGKDISQESGVQTKQNLTDFQIQVLKVVKQLWSAEARKIATVMGVSVDYVSSLCEILTKEGFLRRDVTGEYSVTVEGSRKAAVDRQSPVRSVEGLDTHGHARGAF